MTTLFCSNQEKNYIFLLCHVASSSKLCMCIHTQTEKHIYIYICLTIFHCIMKCTCASLYRIFFILHGKELFSSKEMLNSSANSWLGFIVGCKCHLFPFLHGVQVLMRLSWPWGLVWGQPFSGHIIKNRTSSPSSCLIILAPGLMMGLCTHLPHHLSGFWCLVAAVTISASSCAHLSYCVWKPVFLKLLTTRSLLLCPFVLIFVRIPKTWSEM